MMYNKLKTKYYRR